MARTRTPRLTHQTSRRIAYAAAAGMLLTACSSGAGGPLGEGDDDAGGTTARLVVPVNESPWLDAYRGLVAEYTEQTGVEIELRVFPYDELRTQILNDVQTGAQTYDVFQIDEPNLHEFFANEWIQPLDAVDPGFEIDPAINGYADFSYWNPETRTSDPDGDPMVLPLNGNVHLFIYRKDLYEELGLEVPTTWEDALANGRAAQDADAVPYGHVVRAQATLGGGAQVTYDFLPLLYAYDGNWFTNEGTDWTPAVDSPEVIAAATMMRDLVALGPDATTTIGQAQVIGAMQAGEALQVHVVAAAAPQMESESDSNIAGDVGYAPVPMGPGGTRGVASGVWGLGIPAGISEERSQAALDYITWVLSKEAQVRFTEMGGIPTRGDVLEDADLTEVQREYLSAVQDSLTDVGKHVRYEFSATMLPQTEQRLANILAGSETPEAGMRTLQEQLLDIVTNAGYPIAD